VKRIFIAALAGGLGSLAFAPVQWWPAHWLSLILFFSATNGPALSRASQGVAYGLGFFLPLLHWSGTYVGAFPWVALAILQALFIVPIALAKPLIVGRVPRWIAALGLASAWVLMEALRGRVPWGGFGWGRVAFSQVDSPLVSLVILAGAPLLSFIVVFLSALVALRATKTAIAGLALAIVSAWISPLLSGVSEERTIQVAGVQGNVPRLGLDFNAQRETVLRNHMVTTKRIVPGSVDLVVWPENSSDIDPITDSRIRKELDELVDDVDATFIIGAVLRNDGQLLNAAVQWSPGTGAGSTYIKRRLAPFGEFMPLRTFAEAVVPEAQRVVDFTAGQDVTLFDLKNAAVGSMICFEVLYDDLGRDLVREGATLLIAQTNSATFGTSPQSRQQLQMTRLRAIEHRRSIASVSTSGISAMIDSRGNVLSESDFFEQKVLTAELQTFAGLTPSDRIGGWNEVALVTLPIMFLWWRRR
jgi:apolipoprotein N-acyltransferase